MSEELLQRDLIDNPEKIGRWDFYNIGATTIKALREFNIIRNVDYGAIDRKKVDGIIVQKKNVIAIIENKKPSKLKTKKQKNKAITQEIDVANQLGCKLLIVTDTKETLWINTLTGNQIKDENKKIIKYIFHPKDEKIPELIEKIIYSIDNKTDHLKLKKLVNPTDLAKQIWQDIWSVSGATPENCLYTFIELFIFKYLSDLGVLKGLHSFSTLIKSFETNTAEEVLENYAKAIRPKIKELFPPNPVDKTTIINGTIFVSKDQKAVKGYSSVFKKVLLKFRDYGKLEHIDRDFKSQLFESFLKESISKKNWGQFFTPLKVVNAMVEMAKDEFKEGARICDPACGVGKFLLEPLTSRLDYYYKISKKTIIPKITIHGFDKGFDNDEQKTIILAKANMLIYFSDLLKENPGITKKFSNLFNECFTLNTNSILGTLSETIESNYDLILTNPPYVTSGSSNLKDEIKKNGTLQNHYKINSLGVEGLFMEWIIRALKPKGKAFVVIPDGILNRQNDKNLRQFILDECYLDCIISLPLNTFFTTSKKTYIIGITKKENTKKEQEDPVFTYLVSEIGETRDVNRFEIDQNDLDEAVTLFTFFKGSKQKFDKINTDIRCKIIAYDQFHSTIDSNWTIDNYWSDEEKIELGLLTKDKKYDIHEFSTLIEEVSSNLLDLKSDLIELEQKKKRLITYKPFKIKDIFDPKLGNPKYTKKYGNTNAGTYPVFAASNIAPLTHINHYDFDGEYLTWARNGFAGYVKYNTGKFSINYDRGILIPKNSKINVLYVKYVLEPILRKIAVGRRDYAGNDEFTKLYLSTIENVVIPIPVDTKGIISQNIQKEIINNFIVINDLKNELKTHCEVINSAKITTQIESAEYKEFPIIEVFDILKGNPKFTNKYILKHPGKYPVYSSQTSNKGILGSINSFDYDKECITWTTDGVHAGTVFYRTGKFNMTTHCGALIPKKTFASLIDLSFIYFYLANTLKKYAASQMNKRVTKNIIKEVKIPLPLNPKGNIDKARQTLLSKKMQKIENVKSTIVSEIEKLIGIEIEMT